MDPETQEIDVKVHGAFQFVLVHYTDSLVLLNDCFEAVSHGISDFKEDKDADDGFSIILQAKRFGQMIMENLNRVREMISFSSDNPHRTLNE